MGFGFLREQRLLTPADYRGVFQKPKRSQDQALTVLFRPNRLGRARLGLAISKKSAKRAVDRNRIKRMIRESFRQQDLPAVDVVVLCRPAILSWNNARVFQSLNQHWQYLHRSCATSSSS